MYKTQIIPFKYNATAALSIIGLNRLKLSRVSGLHPNCITDMFSSYRPVKRSSFANVVEIIRSAYDERKDKLAGFERAYVKAWMRHWLKHMVDNGVALTRKRGWRYNDPQHVKIRTKLMKQRKNLLKAYAFAWKTTEEAADAAN